MTNNSKWPPIYVICLIAGAILIGFLAPDASVRVPSAHAASLDDEIPNISGNWAGEWIDTVYPGYDGALSFTILQDGNDFTATGTIDLTDFSMGILPGTGSGTVTREGGRATLNFTFTCPGLGGGVGAQVGGTGGGSGNVTPPLDYGPFTFTGTATNSVIDGTYDFTDPSGGAGTGQMTKDTPVEPSTWGAIKGRYAESGE